MGPMCGVVTHLQLDLKSIIQSGVYSNPNNVLLDHRVHNMDIAIDLI
jgi:hypothetical protein